MKIAVLSDTRAPSHTDFPGHGLGKVVLQQAEGLQARGHDVTLFAAPGSDFPKMVTAKHEHEFAAMNLSGFDVVIDNTHVHGLQRVQPELKIVNVSHDRESKPGRCAVFPSKAHKAHHKQPGRVIYNGVDVPDVDEPIGDYFAFLSHMHRAKAPVWAANAARLAGVKLVMAGTTPPVYPVLDNVQYIGPVHGMDKWQFLARAKALIHPATTEAGPLTVLEAQAVGTPVIVSAWGASAELMQPDVTGFVARNTDDVVTAIGNVSKLDRDKARAHIEANHTVAQVVDGVERAAIDAAKGEVW